MSELTVQAIFGETDDERRQAWTELLASSKRDELRQDPYYLHDMVETQVMLGRDLDGDLFLDYLGHEYSAETVFEGQFLSYLILALKRGTPFQEAWERAVRLISDKYHITQVVYELQFDTDDKYETQLWSERLTGMGVEPDEASVLAHEATALLRQIWLTQDDSFYDGWLSKTDQDDRKILLEKLHADPTPGAMRGGQK